jgi:long-chain acyl-CoA synthetase
MVVGENQKFASALIIPDINKLHFWAAKHKIQFTDNHELVQNPQVIKKIYSEIDKVNTKLAAHEQVKRAKLIIDEWTPLNDMLSQTLKLKRNKIKAKYSETIAEIFKNE